MSYQESLRAGWLLLWRGAVGGLLVGITTTLFRFVFVGLFSTFGIAIRGNAEIVFVWLLNILVAIFIIHPALLRMMMDKDFKGYDLEIVRSEGEEGELTLTYAESLRAGWLVFWRSTALGILYIAIPGFIIGVVGSLLGVSESTIQAVTVFPLALINIFLIVPWVVRMMMRKQFRGFRLQIVRSDTDKQLSDTWPP